MGAELRPYPRMKDSGVESLGEVPEHWEVRRLGQTGSFFKGRGGTKADEIADGVPCVRYGDLYTRHRFFVTDSRACVSPEAAAEKYTPIRYGDVLFAGSGETLGEIGKSAVNLLSDRTCCGGDVIVFRPSIAAHARFLGYAADSPAANSQKARLGRGLTVMHIYSSDLKYLSIGIPPLPEQRAIVRFLDHADRRIRRYIRAKERLIELLEEQQQVIIHQAVTGQIDVRTGQPYPAYKDSGVEWLGIVPEHWDVVALRFRYEQCLGKMLNTKKIVGDHLVPYLRNVDVQWDQINFSDLPRMDIYPHEIARYTLRSDDLLVCEGGEVGRCAVWNEEIKPCGFQKALHRLRPWKIARDRPRFLSYELRVAVGRGAFNDGHESTIGHLTGEKLRSHRFAFPPAAEQRSVEIFLDKNQRRFATLENAEVKAIELLKEYRTRLIADVVTGKLDVRDAAVHLPEVNPIAGGNRIGTIQAESNAHTTECGITNETNP